MLLKFFRKKKNMKRIMWGLAIMIIPAFVIWGAGTSGKKRKGPNYAGRIFDRNVSFKEYADMWSVTRDYLTKSSGRNIPPEFIDQMTWNRLILLEEAKKEGITANDKEVVKRIASFPVFQRNGVFDKKLYKSMLGDSARGFEERVRDDISLSKLREKITANISATEGEAREEYKKKFEKIKASYVSIPFSDFKKDVQYNGKDLLGYYENNKGLFRKGEQINVKYIPIPFSSFSKEVQVTGDNIKRYFEGHTSDFKKPDSEKSPVLDDKIKKEISERLATKRKASLAEELAYKVLDKALNKKGLDEAAISFALKTKETGFFSMHEKVPGIGWSYEFVKKGFELKKGEVSNMLIKGKKGFYIIQLKEKKEPYIPLFTEVKGSVANAYKKERAIVLSQKRAKKIYLTMKNKTGGKETYEDTAKELGLKEKQTKFITRDGYIPGLGYAKKFVEACASLKKGDIAGPVKMPNSWVIIKLDGYQGIDEVKFAKEKKDFRKELLSKKKEAGFNKWFEGLKRKANLVSYTSK